MDQLVQSLLKYLQKVENKFKDSQLKVDNESIFVKSYRLPCVKNKTDQISLQRNF
jgi:hypothetical protein